MHFPLRWPGWRSGLGRQRHSETAAKHLGVTPTKSPVLRLDVRARRVKPAKLRLTPKRKPRKGEKSTESRSKRCSARKIPEETPGQEKSVRCSIMGPIGNCGRSGASFIGRGLSGFEVQKKSFQLAGAAGALKPTPTNRDKKIPGTNRQKNSTGQAIPGTQQSKIPKKKTAGCTCIPPGPPPATR